MNNGYSSAYIHRVQNQLDSTSIKEKPPDTKTVYWKLPYQKEGETELKKSVHTINNQLPSNVRVCVTFSTFKTSQLFNNKDRVSTSLASNIVYKFQCKQCSHCYIGETRRHLITRVMEHIQGRPSPTEVTKHIHDPSIEDFSVILRTPYTKIGETICIKDQQTHLLNDRNSSMPLYLF